MAAPNSSSGKTETYAEGETVLCFHGPLLYEAKILKTKRSHKDPARGTLYQVHYRGWKSTWDEWVAPERMLKLNEETSALAKKLSEEHRGQKNETDRKHEKRPSTHQPKETAQKEKEPPPPKEPKAARREPRPKKAVKEEEGYGTELYHWNPPTKKKADMKLVIPESLKAILVDDWEYVTRNGQLVSLPRQPCVEDLLVEFHQYVMDKPVSSCPPKREEDLGEYLKGVNAYFEEALGAKLLYRFERPQYAEVLRKYAYGPDVPPEAVKTNTQLYGAEHLLRLLVLLPQLVTTTNMENSVTHAIRDYTNLFLEFLAKNKDRFFLTRYEDTSSHYLSIARA